MIDYSQFLIIDTKNTCWKNLVDKKQGERPEIFALDIALIDTEKQTVIEQDSFLIETKNSNISPYCEMLYGISNRKLEEEGVSFEEAYRRLKIHYMSNDRIWGFWGNYSQYYLNAACKERKLDFLFDLPPVEIGFLFSIFSGKCSEESAGSSPITIEDAYEHCGLTYNPKNNAAAEVAKLVLRMGWGLKSHSFFKNKK